MKMKNNILNFLIILSFTILTSTVVFGIYYCCSYNYISTTGIYFKGLNSSEIGAVSAIGLNKKNEPIRNIGCYEQYRVSDDYIYKDWRRDFKFNDLINKIIILIPDSLHEKIDFIWFKSGINVYKCSGEEFRNSWSSKLNNTIYEYTVPESIVPSASLSEGFVCLIKSENFHIHSLRKLYIFLSLLLIIIISYRFRNITKSLIKTIWSNLINFFHKKTKRFKQLLVFCLGIVFVFLILEFSLRIFGYLHTKNNIDKQLSVSTIPTNSILCIGDSFTESIGSTKNNDYPSLLEKIINENDYSYSVINLGLSGKNTAQISMEMPYYIDVFNPKIAIILAGGANYWNYWGYQEESFISSLKTVKLFKLLFDNINYQNSKNRFNIDEYNQRRIHYKQSLIIDENALSPFILKIRSLVNSNKIESLDSCLENIELSEEDIYHLIAFSILTSKPTQLINNLDIKKLQNHKVRFLTTVYRNLLLNEQNDISIFPPEYNAIYLFAMQMIASEFSKEVMEKCLKLNPYFEDPYFHLSSLGEDKIIISNNYYKNRFSISDSIFYYKLLFGLDSETSIFNNSHIIESLDLNIKTAAIDQWVSNDIEKMVDICNQRKIQIVLMNYPTLNKSSISNSVNQVLSDFAIKNNIVFVNNTQLFDTITTDRLSYFISDGHCNDKGYMLMAQNIFKILVENKIIDKPKKENAQ